MFIIFPQMIKNWFTWQRFERFSKIAQLVILIVGVGAFIQIPIQIKQARQSMSKNAFDVLWQIDTRLRERLNDRIYLAIEHKRPVITKKITKDDLDIYLSDLTSIEDACTRGLITDDDAYDWFSDYIVPAYENKEIQEYIAELRKEDADYYVSFDELYKRVQRYAKTKDKKNK